MYLYVCAAVVGVSVHDGSLQQSLVESGTKDVRAHLLEKSGRRKTTILNVVFAEGKIPAFARISGENILNYRWAVRFPDYGGTKNNALHFY